jgi:hypothetical protein
MMHDEQTWEKSEDVHIIRVLNNDLSMQEYRYASALDAVHAFDKFKDVGDAKEERVVILLERGVGTPNHVKKFTRAELKHTYSLS